MIPPPPHLLNTVRPGMISPFHSSVELIYAAIIIIICIIIYTKTREIYQLSKYSGIHFFRQTFIFFGLAFLFRLIPLFFKLTELHRPEMRLGFFFGFFLFNYASSMAIFSIVRSLSWKRLQKQKLFNNSWIYHIMAIVLATIPLLQKVHIIGSLIQITIIIFSLIILIQHYPKTKKKFSTFMTYLLLLLFWMINIIITSIPRFMELTIDILYLCSLIVFSIILKKVIRNTKR